MRFLFRTQAIHSTAERRLLSFADEAGTPENAENVDPEALRTKLRTIITADNTMRSKLETTVTELIQKHGGDADIVEKCKKAVMLEVEKQGAWTAIPSHRERANIRGAIPPDFEGFVNFAIDANILKDEEADKQLQEFKKSRPSHMNDVSNEEPSAVDVASENLIARYRENQKRSRANFNAQSKTRGGRLTLAVKAEREEIEAERQALVKELKRAFGENWSYMLREIDHQKAVTRRAQILAKEEQGRRHDDEMGITRGRVRFASLDESEEIVGGIRRRKARPRADITDAQRIAAQMKEGDFDITQVPTYEYRIPKNFKVNRTINGVKTDVTEDWLSYQPGADGRNAPDGSNNNRPRGKRYTERPAMFGRGTISERGHDEAVKRSTSHVDKNEQAKLLVRNLDGFAEQVDNARQLLEKDFKKDELRSTIAYAKLAFHRNTMGMPDDPLKQKIYLQEEMDLIKEARSEIMQQRSLDSMANGITKDAVYLPVVPRLNNAVYIQDLMKGEEFTIQPHLLFSDSKDAQMQTLRELHRRGLIVKFEREGKEIENTLGKKNVSGIYFDFRTPEAKASSRYSISTKGPKQKNIEQTVGDGVPKPKTEVEAIPLEDRLHQVELPLSLDTLPFQLSVGKDGKSRVFSREQLRDSWLIDNEIGFVIQKHRGKYFMHFYKMGEYRVFRQDMPGGNFDLMTSVKVDKKAVAPEQRKEMTDKEKPEAVQDDEQFNVDVIEKATTPETFNGILQVLTNIKDGIIEKAKKGGVSNDLLEKFKKDFSDRVRPFEPGNSIIQNGPGAGRNHNAWNLEQLHKTNKYYFGEIEKALKSSVREGPGRGFEEIPPPEEKGKHNEQELKPGEKLPKRGGEKVA